MRFLLKVLASLCILVVVGQAQDVSLDDLLKEIFTQSPNQQPVTSPSFQPIQPASSNNNNFPSATQTPLVRPTQPEPPVQTNYKNKCSDECVPYYLCNNNELITDGSGLLDIRIDVPPEEGECSDYLLVCCAAEDKMTKPVQPQIPNHNQNQNHNHNQNQNHNHNQNQGQPQQSQGCGYRHKDGVGFRISGGQDNEAEYGEFPWMVAILKEERALAQTLNTYQCGGSLIHPSVVLTAAHCVDGKDPTQLKIRAGEWDTQTKNEMWPHQDRAVARMIVHPRYSKSNLVNDIALLVLEEPVQLEPHISTACLPRQDVSFGRAASCFASGWGKDVFGKEGKYQVILKKVEMPMVPHEQCQASLRTTRLGRRFQLSNTFVCAGGEAGRDTCKGDGGSPLVCPVPGQPDRYYQTGIVAWGIGCGENQIPGVYVNVAKFRSWVDNEMRGLHLDTQSYTA